MRNRPSLITIVALIGVMFLAGFWASLTTTFPDHAVSGGFVGLLLLSAFATWWLGQQRTRAVRRVPVVVRRRA